MLAPRYDTATLFNYESSGTWNINRPEEGATGRYNPHMIQRRSDRLLGPYDELNVVYERPVFEALKNAGMTPDYTPNPKLSPKENDVFDAKTARGNAWSSSQWHGQHNPVVEGIWELDFKAPDTPGIGFAVMLWAKSDAKWPKQAKPDKTVDGKDCGTPIDGSPVEWPDGEMNIAEGRTGTGKVLTNLHYKGANYDPNFDGGFGHHEPVEIDLDSSKMHRYRVQVAPGLMRWWVDGVLRRELYNIYVPHRMQMHLAAQIAPYPADIGQSKWINGFHDKAILRPIRMPG